MPRKIPNEVPEAMKFCKGCGRIQPMSEFMRGIREMKSCRECLAKYKGVNGYIPTVPTGEPKKCSRCEQVKPFHSFLTPRNQIAKQCAECRERARERTYSGNPTYSENERFQVIRTADPVLFPRGSWKLLSEISVFWRELLDTAYIFMRSGRYWRVAGVNADRAILTECPPPPDDTPAKCTHPVYKRLPEQICHEPTMKGVTPKS